MKSPVVNLTAKFSSNREIVQIPQSLTRLMHSGLPCLKKKSFTKSSKSFHAAKEDVENDYDDDEDDDDNPEDIKDVKPRFWSNAEHPDYEDGFIKTTSTNALEIFSKTFKLNPLQVEEAFYLAKTRKNHTRISRKETTLKPLKDVFDVVIKFDDDFVWVRRVQMLAVMKSDKIPKTWKQNRRNGKCRTWRKPVTAVYCEKPNILKQTD